MRDNNSSIIALIIFGIILYKCFRRRIPGFYDRYINSARWRRRSRWCRRLAFGICKTVNCRNAAHHAHHRSYRFLASWTPIEIFDLVALCRSCHSGLHRVEGGRLASARRKNPKAKRDPILRQTTNDWINGEIERKKIVA